MFHGFRVTAQEEGFRALGKGWAPTLIGYSMQGLCKFGFYEVFKIFYSNLLGEVRFAVCLLYCKEHPLSTLLPCALQCQKYWYQIFWGTGCSVWLVVVASIQERRTASC